MKRYIQYILFFLGVLCVDGAVVGQTLTEVLLPRYMYGNGASSGNIVPYVFRARLSGLLPETQYRYNVMAVTSADSKTVNGSGNVMIVRDTDDFGRYTGTNLSGSAPTFTTDGGGAYVGWFVLLPVQNNRFNSGNELFIQINTVQSGAGTAPSFRFYTTNTVKVLSWGTAADNATGIRTTKAARGEEKDVVMLFEQDNPSAGDRPVSGAFLESDGFSVAPFSGSPFGFAPFYTSDVDGKSRTWGTLIPNSLAGGIHKMVRYKMNGAEAGNSASATGSWPAVGGANISTANANGGITNVIALDGNRVALGPVGSTPQTISFNPVPLKTYGDPSFPSGAVASSGLPVSFISSNPAVAVVENGVIIIKGAGTTEITATQSGDATTFMPADDVTQTITVSKARLSVRADSKSRLVGFPNPEFTVSCTGLVYNETQSQAFRGGMPVLTTVADINTAPGEYPIILNVAVQPNYEITEQNNAILTVMALPSQTIQFEEIPKKKYGDRDFSLTAVSSTGQPLLYTSSNPAVAVIQGYTIHITGIGVTSITASQPGNSRNLPATPVTRTLTVEKGKLTITAYSHQRKIGQPNPELTVYYEGFAEEEDSAVLSVHPVISTPATITSLAGEYPINVSAAKADNYDISFVPGKLTVYSALTPKDEMSVYCDAPGRIKVNIYMLAAEQIDIGLFDATGRRCALEKVSAEKGFNSFYININGLPAGIYPVVVSNKRILLKAKAFVLR